MKLIKKSNVSKVLIIVGSTVSGKSELGVLLAKKFQGEVISADSRQVYSGLNVGSGKVPLDVEGFYKGVRHHMIDVASPRRQFSVARFVKLGRKALCGVLKREKFPIIVGGTGFYVDALLRDGAISSVPPQSDLRERLARRLPEDLYHELILLDPERAKKIDVKNKRRLIRAVEIAMFRHSVSKHNALRFSFQVLKIGLLVPREELKQKIWRRLLERLGEGMIEEVRRLREEERISWDRLDGLGLEYRYVSRHLRGLLTYEEMVDELYRAICRYAKRQMTWFRRDKEITWFSPKEYKKIEHAVREFFY